MTAIRSITQRSLNRRTFLAGCSAAIAAMSGARLTDLAFAHPSAGLNGADVIVSVFLRGGIDGLNFSAQAVQAEPTPPRETIHVHAVPGREALEIAFPRVEGYRIELPDERLVADFSKLEPYVLDPARVGATEVTMAGIIGETETLTLEHLEKMRRSTLVFRLATHLLNHTLRDADERPKLHLFPQAQAIVSQWLDSALPEASLDELLHDLASRARKKKVKDVLSDRPMVSVDEGASLLKVAYAMYSENIKTIPVTRAGEIVGVVYRGAVFEAIADRIGGKPQPKAN